MSSTSNEVTTWWLGIGHDRLHLSSIFSFRQRRGTLYFLISQISDIFIDRLWGYSNVIFTFMLCRNHQINLVTVTSLECPSRSIWADSELQRSNRSGIPYGVCYSSVSGWIPPEDIKQFPPCLCWSSWKSEHQEHHHITHW